MSRITGTIRIIRLGMTGRNTDRIGLGSLDPIRNPVSRSGPDQALSMTEQKIIRFGSFHRSLHDRGSRRARYSTIFRTLHRVAVFFCAKVRKTTDFSSALTLETPVYRATPCISAQVGGAPPEPVPYLRQDAG